MQTEDSPVPAQIKDEYITKKELVQAIKEASSPVPFADSEGIAGILGVKPRLVEQMARERRIPFFRVGPKLIRFDPVEVRAHFVGQTLDPVR